MEVIASYPKKPQATPPSHLRARGLHGVVFSLYELYIDDWVWCVYLVRIVGSYVQLNVGRGRED